MSPEKQREIASKGGRAAHQKGTAHEWSSDEARDAGRKGGMASRGGRGKLPSDRASRHRLRAIPIRPRNFDPPATADDRFRGLSRHGFWFYPAIVSVADFVRGRPSTSVPDALTIIRRPLPGRLLLF